MRTRLSAACGTVRLQPVAAKSAKHRSRAVAAPANRADWSAPVRARLGLAQGQRPIAARLVVVGSIRARERRSAQVAVAASRRVHFATYRTNNHFDNLYVFPR